MLLSSSCFDASSFLTWLFAICLFIFFFVGLAYLGEYPLSWAACLDDKVTYNLLIRHGADPNLQDTFGNMILHIIVARERLMFYSFALKHPFRQARDDITNIYGFTPLTMACLLGRDKVFAEIIEIRCFEFWTYSIITCCGYPLNLIDSIQLVKMKDGISAKTDPNSALTLISSGSSDQHIEMLRGGIVQKLLEEKWKTFGYVKFTRSLMITFIYLLTLSVVVFLRPSRTAKAPSSSLTSSNLCVPQSQQDKYMSYSLQFWVKSVAELVTTIACLKLLSNHAIEVASKGWSNYMKGLVCVCLSSLYHSSFFTFTISKILSLHESDRSDRVIEMHVPIWVISLSVIHVSSYKSCSVCHQQTKMNIDR